MRYTGGRSTRRRPGSTHPRSRKTNGLVLLVAEEGQEDVVADLDGVDVEEALLRRDELEVDGVRRHPHGPGANHSGLDVALDLGLHVTEGVAGGEAHVREEDGAEDRVEQDLVNADLGGHGGGVSARELTIKEAVEVVAHGAVEQETEGGEAGKAGKVELLDLLHEELGEDVAKGEAHERREALHDKGVSLEGGVVLVPKAATATGSIGIG
mmetsp:Transcript_875/g.2359  ORF Transcript_875/g.2359 Transcript_875/m.2359 type:complete len:211 (-) Transcript_875:120-752(-)